MKDLIGIAGGIGSGKSVVSRMLRCRGYAVYDCDYEARRLMNECGHIRKALVGRWGEEACPAGGNPDRRLISARVFGDEKERLWLNGLVHAEVRADLKRWIERCSADAGIPAPLFVESAIMGSSAIAASCREIWEVTASETERIRRVGFRSGLAPEETRSRMESQNRESGLLRERGYMVRVLDNDGNLSLMLQIDALLKQERDNYQQ